MNNRLTDAVKLTGEQLAQLQALPEVPNIEDVPEAPAANWRFARRLFTSRREAISLRLDADVLDWLRLRGDQYETEINRILRERMIAELTAVR